MSYTILLFSCKDHPLEDRKKLVVWTRFNPSGLRGVTLQSIPTPTQKKSMLIAEEYNDTKDSELVIMRRPCQIMLIIEWMLIGDQCSTSQLAMLHYDSPNLLLHKKNEHSESLPQKMQSMRWDKKESLSLHWGLATWPVHNVQCKHLNVHVKCISSNIQRSVLSSSMNLLIWMTLNFIFWECNWMCKCFWIFECHWISGCHWICGCHLISRLKMK